MEQISWKPRGWDWVDPLKDAQVIVLKLQNGLITYADALASLGLDFEETMTERVMKQAIIEALGITLGTDITGVADTADDDSATADDSGGDSKVKRTTFTYKPLRFAAPSRKQLDSAHELFRELRSYGTVQA